MEGISFGKSSKGENFSTEHKIDYQLEVRKRKCYLKEIKKIVDLGSLAYLKISINEFFYCLILS